LPAPLSHSYALQWLTVLPLEIIAASLTISYWGETLPKAVFVSIFLSIILLINLFGVKAYGEAEFTFSIIKVIAVIGFMYVWLLPSSSPRPVSLEDSVHACEMSHGR
jgi:amino acid transporter